MDPQQPDETAACQNISPLDETQELLDTARRCKLSIAEQFRAARQALSRLLAAEFICNLSYQKQSSIVEVLKRCHDQLNAESIEQPLIEQICAITVENMKILREQQGLLAMVTMPANAAREIIQGLIEDGRRNIESLQQLLDGHVQLASWGDPHDTKCLVLQDMAAYPQDPMFYSSNDEHDLRKAMKSACQPDFLNRFKLIHLPRARASS